MTAGQLDCHKLHNDAGSVLVIHDWVVAQQDECVTSIPETPPTSRLKSIIQDCDHEHSSNESGTESYEATRPSGSCASSYNEDEGDSLATPPSPLHTVTFKAMGPTKIPGAQDSKGCFGLRTRQAIIYLCCHQMGRCHQRAQAVLLALVSAAKDGMDFLEYMYAIDVMKIWGVL